MILDIFGVAASTDSRGRTGHAPLGADTDQLVVDIQHYKTQLAGVFC